METIKQKNLIPTLNFGLSGLTSRTLSKHFYPDDIPEDWLLDYYSNEFHVILLAPEELTSDSIDKAGSMSFDAFMEQVKALSEEFSESEFRIILDVSKLQQEQLEVLQTVIDDDDNTVFELFERRSAELINKDEFHFVLEWGMSLSKRRISVYCVSEQSSLSAEQLKNMIEFIRVHSQQKAVDLVSVIFLDDIHALEHCRNAMILESMM